MFARVVRIAGIASIVAVALGVVALLLAQVAPGTLDRLAFRPFETGGLVFVESPEVYTRQRLVNDRYEQDAWLRSKLAEIDDATLIEQSERYAIRGQLSAGLSDDSSAVFETPPAEVVLSEDDIPFGPKFAIQSSLRDKIRQRILENALDDRHDLSGNTVYGLKFDTAVIPGRNTWKSPTVVVKLADSDIDLFRGNTAEAAPLYTRAPYIDFAELGTEEDQDGVQEMNRYFDRWRRNLERRLNDHKTELGVACTPTAPGETSAFNLKRRNLCDDDSETALPACPARFDRITYADWFAATPLCTVASPPTADGTYRIAANPYATETLLPSMLPQASHLNDAIEFKLRVPPRQADHGESIVSWIRQRATNLCNSFNTSLPPGFLEDTANHTYFTRAGALSGPIPSLPQGQPGLFDPKTAPRSVSDFVSTLASSQEATLPAALPGPWGTLFQIQLAIRPPRGAMCSGAAIDMRLLEREIGMMIVEGNSSDQARAVLPTAGWSALRCLARPCVEQDVTVWVERGSAPTDEALQEIFDRPTLESLIRDTSPDGGPSAGRQAPTSACTSSERGYELQFGKLDPSEPWYFYGDTRLPEGAEASFFELACIAGRSLQVKTGAYRFLQRMAAIDSYTYAAFPRGDVTGVVSETDSMAGVSFSAPTVGPVGSPLATGLTTQSQTSAVEALPSIINFATGGGQDEFDFGWSIVKDGRKKPMLASQVVLLSVPAYLEQIELQVWRGFIDVDHTATNGPVGVGLSDTADATPVHKIEAFTRSQEPTIMRLRVPPDYTALDGIIIGNDVLSGPQIQEKGLTGDRVCHRMWSDRDFSIAILGDRLWRSTVVTLDGVKADRIEVMPDMGGILAVFTAPRAQEGQSAPQSAVYLPGQDEPRTLAVWTSEGSDDMTVKTCGVVPSVAESDRTAQAE